MVSTDQNFRISGSDESGDSLKETKKFSPAPEPDEEDEDGSVANPFGMAESKQPAPDNSTPPPNPHHPRHSKTPEDKNKNKSNAGEEEEHGKPVEADAHAKPAEEPALAREASAAEAGGLGETLGRNMHARGKMGLAIGGVAALGTLAIAAAEGYGASRVGGKLTGHGNDPDAGKDAINGALSNIKGALPGAALTGAKIGASVFIPFVAAGAEAIATYDSLKHGDIKGAALHGTEAAAFGITDTVSTLGEGASAATGVGVAAVPLEVAGDAAARTGERAAIEGGAKVIAEHGSQMVEGAKNLAATLKPAAKVAQNFINVLGAVQVAQVADAAAGMLNGHADLAGKVAGTVATDGLTAAGMKTEDARRLTSEIGAPVEHGLDGGLKAYATIRDKVGAAASDTYKGALKIIPGTAQLMPGVTGLPAEGNAPKPGLATKKIPEEQASAMSRRVPVPHMPEV